MRKRGCHRRVVAIREEGREEGGNVNEGALEGEEEEEEEEEYATVETYVTEQEFDFRDFVLRFAVKSVCIAYSRLFAAFRRNSDHTNHCVAKMFHRVAYDCRMPGLLYQACIFRTFQQVGVACFFGLSFDE